MSEPPFAKERARPASIGGRVLPVACGSISAALLAASTFLWIWSCWVDREVVWWIGGTPIRLGIASAHGVFKAWYISDDGIRCSNSLTYSRSAARKYTVPPAIRADSNGLPAFRTVPPRPTLRPLRIGNPIGGRVRYGKISVAGWFVTLVWASVWLAYSIFRRRRRVWQPAFECVAPKKRSVEPTGVRP
jgi:hypothetical protein